MLQFVRDPLRSAAIAAIVSFCAATDEVPCARLAGFVGFAVASVNVVEKEGSVVASSLKAA